MKNSYILPCTLLILACLMVSGIAQESDIKLIPGMTVGVEAQESAREMSPTPAGVIVPFNDMAPPLVLDKTYIVTLKSVSPQWAVQQLEFPQDEEIEKYCGRASPEQISEFEQWIARAIKQRFIPSDITRHLIPLRNWAILYRDWIDHGGSDTFVVQYHAGSYTVRISETPNYILVAIRDLDQGGRKSKEEHIQFVFDTSLKILTNDVLPKTVQDISKNREALSEATTSGFWAARVLQENANTKSADNISEPSDMPSDSVKFFTDGQFIVFQIFKYVWSKEMKNPFEPRFAIETITKIDESLWDMVEREIKENPDLKTPEKRIQFYENMKTRLVTKQIEEYLGPLLYDYEGTKLSSAIPISQIEKAFSDLNDIQKNHLLKQRKSDEFYVEGLKAFNEKRYDIAVGRWTEALSIDPMNVRCALLVTLATDFMKDKMQQTMGKIDFENPTLAKAISALMNHKQAILRYELSDREQTLKDREIAQHRVLAIDYYSKGMYEMAIKEWDEVLKIDPQNPQAALFKDLATKRLGAKDILESQDSIIE